MAELIDAAMPFIGFLAFVVAMFVPPALAYWRTGDEQIAGVVWLVTMAILAAYFG